MKTGETGKIASFNDDEIAGKLMTMGILPGSSVYLVRKAPFKGGLYIKVDGCKIALRHNEAACIVLSEVAQ